MKGLRIPALVPEESCVVLGRSLNLSEPITMNIDKKSKNTARRYVKEPNFLEATGVSEIPAFSPVLSTCPDHLFWNIHSATLMASILHLRGPGDIIGSNIMDSIPVLWELILEWLDL